MIYEEVSIKQYSKNGNIHQKVATADRKVIDSLLAGNKKEENKIDKKIDVALDDLFGTLSMNPVTYKDGDGSIKMH